LGSVLGVADAGVQELHTHDLRIVELLI